MDPMTGPTKEIAKEIRRRIIKMHRRGPNVGSALSSADIIAVLYFDVMNIESPTTPDRDRFILSKGHAVSALYAALSLKGFFAESLLDTYLCDGSPLTGHPVRGSIPGIEVSTGSLGHGLSIATGMALAAKHDGNPYRIYVLMGDGECQEGSVWESAIHASRLRLDNITVIVDANNLQGYERVENILPFSSLKAIWEAFGWAAIEVDGHDLSALKSALSDPRSEECKPTAILAKTVKGKGIALMEDKLGWHYFSVSPDQVTPFLEELNRRR